MSSTAEKIIHLLRNGVVVNHITTNKPIISIEVELLEEVVKELTAEPKKTFTIDDSDALMARAAANVVYQWIKSTDEPLTADVSVSIGIMIGRLHRLEREAGNV